MEIVKAQGNYDLKNMQNMATVASTADGLLIEGNNFKVTALTGCPDMLLFACERIDELEALVRSFSAGVVHFNKSHGDMTPILEAFIESVKVVKPKAVDSVKNKITPQLSCKCSRSDAWRCAKDRAAAVIACKCLCHRQQVTKEG